jgi:hypothetical protein
MNTGGEKPPLYSLRMIRKGISRSGGAEKKLIKIKTITISILLL